MKSGSPGIRFHVHDCIAWYDASKKGRQKYDITLELIFHPGLKFVQGAVAVERQAVS